MTIAAAAARLAALLRDENALLADCNLAAAVKLVGAKQAALAAFESALPHGRVPPAMAVELRDLAQRNRTLLAQAVEVQGRILEMVARAARAASPDMVRYGARGAQHNEGRALAFGLRA